MAKLPGQKKIWAFDVKAPSWARQMIESVNSFMQTVTEALDGRLTVGDNISLDFIELDVNGSAPSVSFRNTLRRPLKGILVAQVLVGNSSVSVGEWMEVGGRITVNLQGLTGGVDYKIRFLLV